MKKLNKFFAILVSLAMMATLCVMSAFAADGTTDEGPPWGTGDNAKLVKYLQAGEGVAVPAGTVFNFNFAPRDGAPAATNTTIAFADMTADTNTDYIGYKTLNQLFPAGTFTKAGEYIYDVTETAATVTLGDNEALTTNDNQSSYVLHVYVKNGDNGPVIDKVSVEEEDGAKVDPTIKEDVADDGTVNGEDKGFAFTNTFKKDLVDPDQGEDEQDKRITEAGS